MSRPSILVSESSRFSPVAASLLAEVGDLQLADLDRPGLLAHVEHADVLWVRLRNRIDRGVLRRASRLKMIATATTGLNHIDLDAAAERNVRVVSLKGETDFLQTIHATAEHTLTLMLALLRNLPAAAAHVVEGGWNRDLFQGGELHGRTVGIIGYGRVGRMVGQLATAFGARVLACDRTYPAPPGLDGRLLYSREEVLERSDIVSLHVNLSKETEGFFGAREFQRMKPGALFVNTARGELLDERSLLEALEHGPLGGVALDVLSNETETGMNEHPLVSYARMHSNVIVTPHIGGCTAESMAATECFIARKVRALLPDLMSPHVAVASDGEPMRAES